MTSRVMSCNIWLKNSLYFWSNAVCALLSPTMRWLRCAGSLRLYVSFAKEPYKRDDFVQNRPIFWRTTISRLICHMTWLESCDILWDMTWRLELYDMPRVMSTRIIWHDSSHVIYYETWLDSCHVSVSCHIWYDMPRVMSHNSSRHASSHVTCRSRENETRNGHRNANRNPRWSKFRSLFKWAIRKETCDDHRELRFAFRWPFRVSSSREQALVGGEIAFTVCHGGRKSLERKNVYFCEKFRSWREIR